MTSQGKAIQNIEVQMATTMNVMQKGKNPNCFDRNPKEDWKAIILRNGKNVVGPILVDEDE